MEVKKILAVIAGGLAVVSFFAGNPVVLLAVGVILLASVALI
jgi:hypothetical protein